MLITMELSVNLVIIFITFAVRCVHDWCLAYSMKLDFSKIRVISFTRKTCLLNHQYILGNSHILRTECINDLGVCTDYELHFHHRVDFIFSHVMKLLGLICTITFSFFTIHSLVVLHFAFVRFKLEHASLPWKYVLITDYNKLEHIQRKFPALCHRVFQARQYR
jgi:hypothetical protein